MASTNYAFMKSDKVRYDHDQHKYKDIETGTHSDAARYPRKKISINFDKKGRMWYTYIDEDGIYIASKYYSYRKFHRVANGSLARACNLSPLDPPGAF